MKGFVEVTLASSGLRYTLPVMYMTVGEKESGAYVCLASHPEWYLNVSESYERVRELMAEALTEEK